MSVRQWGAWAVVGRGHDHYNRPDRQTRASPRTPETMFSCAPLAHPVRRAWPRLAGVVALLVAAVGLAACGL
ncbi:MAG: hypothetical protein KIT52_19455, partial [Anaerolineae bacterium]|nr:hypothetical protein [Anaerolineae bacterium]